MLDYTVIEKANQLKKTMDAAYTVFRKRPSVENAAKHTTATAAFTDYCTNAIIEMIKEINQEDTTDKRAEILAKFDEYKLCTRCGAELLYMVDKDQYVENIDFLEDFPGWCYSCLLEYCTTHRCEDCTVTVRNFDCPFVEVKKLHE